MIIRNVHSCAHPIRRGWGVKQNMYVAESRSQFPFSTDINSIG
jgi:hypothetical protein